MPAPARPVSATNARRLMLGAKSVVFCIDSPFLVFLVHPPLPTAIGRFLPCGPASPSCGRHAVCLLAVPCLGRNLSRPDASLQTSRRNIHGICLHFSFGHGLTSRSESAHATPGKAGETGPATRAVRRPGGAATPMSARRRLSRPAGLPTPMSTRRLDGAHSGLPARRPGSAARASAGAKFGRRPALHREACQGQLGICLWWFNREASGLWQKRMTMA